MSPNVTKNFFSSGSKLDFTTIKLNLINDNIRVLLTLKNIILLRFFFCFFSVNNDLQMDYNFMDNIS